MGDLNPSKALRTGTGVRFGLSEVPRVVSSSPNGKIKVTDVCTAPLSKKENYAILRPSSLSLPWKLWNAMRSCDMVVADSPWDLDTAALSESQVMIALIAAASGASVLPVRAWGACVILASCMNQTPGQWE